ncbi:MAG TPA: TonB family protein [Candidatus Obscuribacterales bacterium]
MKGPENRTIGLEPSAFCTVLLCWLLAHAPQALAGLTTEPADTPVVVPIEVKPAAKPRPKKPEPPRARLQKPVKAVAPAAPVARAKVALPAKAAAAVPAKPPVQAQISRPPQLKAIPPQMAPVQPLTPETAKSAAAPVERVDPAVVAKKVEHYVSLLKHAIAGAWHPPADRQGHSSLVAFKVGRQGTVSDIEVRTSSGDKELDALAVKTIQSLSPFYPLPEGAPEKVPVDFTFQPPPPAEATGPEDELSRRRRYARSHPSDGKAAFEYGKALRFADQYQEAIEELKRAMKVGHPAGPCLVEMALAYKKLGKFEEAESSLKQAVKQAPDLAPAQRHLGDLYYEQKRWGDSMAAYREFLKLQPSGPVSELANMRIQLCQRRLGGGDGSDE